MPAPPSALRNAAAPSATPPRHACAAADPTGPLRERAATAWPGCAVRWVEQTGSTNADLLAAARAGDLTGPTVLATGNQTAGRGRQGRPWRDQPGAAVLCSIAWPHPRQHALGPLSLAAGVWLAQALRALGAPAVRLKWPNDLLLPAGEGWCKLGGVLVEVADTPAARWAVIGFGINLRAPQPPNHPPVTAVPTGALPPCGLDAAGAQPPLLLALDRLAGAVLEGLHAGDLAAALARWPALHAWAGQPVVALERGQVLASGIAAGIAPDGALLLQTADGLRAVRSADVSLRLSPSPQTG